jgi:7-carboxy-7-deazaguanine synthase
MRISEIFYSIQGEGILTGVPSVFIRTSGCNLRCTWCDTPYTSWEPDGQEVALSEILGKVSQYSAGHVVITGGEPMISPEIVELTRQLGHHITVETAGTVFKPVVCDLMSISPKLANSTPQEDRWADRHERTRYQPEVLKELISRYEYQMKFVVNDREDISEIRDIVEALGIDKQRVLLMPQGRNREELAARSEEVVKLCIELGYRFCPRVHIEIWGNRRGV